MEETRKLIEVGYGIGKGNDSFSTGAEAAQNAISNIKENPLSVVIVFSSVCFDLEDLLKGINSVIGNVPVIGTTTAGEIFNSPQKESVVIVALASQFIKMRLGIGQRVSKNWKQALAQAIGAPEIQPIFSSREKDYWQKLTQEGKTSFALLFSPGNTRHAHSVSYEILEELKRMSNGFLPIFGGSSADDWRMESNYVFSGQGVYSDSILLAVFETHLRFGIGMTHGFVPSSNQAYVNKVRGHEVLELDRQPADEVYAKMLGTSKEALKGKHLTLTTGQPIGFPDPYGQYNINVASYFTPQNGVRLTQPVAEGSLFTIMKADPDNMIIAGREALRKALLRGSITEPAVAFVFSCALRTRILNEQTADEILFMKALLPDVPIVGFYSFGEQGLADDGVNRHNNEVITTLVIGQELTHSAQVALENKRLIKALKSQIDERKIAEKALRNSEERYRAIAEDTPVLICRFLPGGEIIYVNDAYRKYFHKNQEELIGSNFQSLIPEANRKTVMKNIQSLTAESSTQSHEHPVIKPNGNIRWQRWTNRALFDDEGRVFSYQAIGEDITERKRLEEQLRQSQKMESIGTLAGGIAHDFNNILGIILGNAELALDDVPEWNPARHNLKDIRSVCLRARDVVRQLLSFARKSGLEKKPIDIATIVRESLKLLRSSIPTNIEIRQNISKDIDIIMADPTQINQVLINLFTNAEHAILDEGMIEVTLKNLELKEDTAAQYPELNPGRFVTITVSDTGHGISQEEIDRIFDPYFTTKKLEKGTGMGLAVVHGIVKEHNGLITVESELGKGTTFSIFFPAIEKEAVVEIEIDEELPSGNEYILFIDDEELLVQLGCQRLERLGYKVEATTNPIEALDQFRSKPNKFDLVITDMTMPQITGDKLVKEILNIRSDIPIILCTGFSEKIDEKKAKEIGATDYIEKPVDMLDFAFKVRKVLDVK